ncbi:MAG: hypothetical protein K9M45_12860 [Kiritimatiellales bacterium]|nr:hypothetical protein [Kiritimatiellales bacterium]
MIKEITFEIEEDGGERSTFLFLADMLEKLAAENFSIAIAVAERLAPIIKSMDGLTQEAKALEMVAEGGRILLAIPRYAKLRSAEENDFLKQPGLKISVAKKQRKAAKAKGTQTKGGKVK